MSMVTKVAKMRLFFHANMLDICNVANQLGILKDDKAEEVMKGHTMKCFDAMEHMGLNVKKYLEERRGSPSKGSFFLRKICTDYYEREDVS